ncbi:UvrD-helicase domain-containing protein [Bacillus thuringiensis]|uniref:UvrD-helicase domain-containing protein n=1 Tax=Bacillus thuringiensis TaxID=1428 RepID=UPI000BF3BCC1|nr:UvrD-helicase domain-containing protein [Bacillus thuringiensis]PFL06523.1 DNA helicase UvrD [Bacillus thuringiensis]PGU47396.1 DNA helicase UvrD [Bacillus thuringiensis]
MFIEGMVEYRPGIDAERYVWRKVKSVFIERESFGFLHFPMFKENHASKREIDILLVDREIGVTVIEVKGINIKQIQGIQGHIWHFTKDYYVSKGEPFNQAEQQLNMLCDDIEKKDSLNRAFSKRAVVALPYITSEQWIERGFNQLLNTPFILFKDDFEQGTWIQKLERMNIYKARLNLQDSQWDALKKHFYIRDLAREKTDEIKSEKQKRFSNLYVFTSEEQFHKEKEEIEKLLKEGLKIYIFSTFSISKNWLALQKDFCDEFQLQVFQTKETLLSVDTRIIQDGEVEASFLKNILSPAFPEFNLGQYIAVHTPHTDNLMITAGAGTGKTYVMIDRIFYLLEKVGITLKDIIMVTFTNASTNEMKERLQKKLLSMFKLTGKTKYLYFAEEVKNIQISTIHAFSKSILTQLAHEIGFGRNLKVRSFIKTKSDILEKLANEFFQKHPAKVLVDLNLKFYEVIKMMKSFWDEMEKKGLTRQEIELIDWGTVVKEEHQVLKDLFQYVFKQCEGLLEAQKKKENAIDTGDMVRKLKLFTQGDTLKQLQTDKYLFVDEFQDSDNTQIELVASLQNQLKYHLFVVGDIKQSIYRFRGADYTSFTRLAERVNSSFTPVALNQNYRTTSSLLEKLDKVFSVWGQKCWGPKGKESLLPYTEDDRLKGMKITESTIGEFLYPNINKDNVEEETVRQILESVDIAKQLSDDENKRIALVVRTNKQALEVREWCEKAGIGTVQNLDGTFYKSDAVIHFKMMLDALLYPGEAKHVVNFLQSPYFRYAIPTKLLVPLKGDSEKIIKFLQLHMGNDFTQYLDELKRLPVMAVIQKVISEKGLLQNISSYYEVKYGDDPDIDESIKQLEIELAVKQYEKNLYHLMNIIQKQFDSMSGTLWNIHEWLTLQIRVNRNENEPMIETKLGVVEITTVHRSKGLEYHTVIMPKLNHSFSNKQASFYIQDEKEMGEDKRIVGWKAKDIKNNHFATLQNYESFEVEREETRLLYVAMTRAKKRLILMMPEKISENTWGNLLGRAFNEVNHER